jgi:hypothetical protein
LSSAEKCHYLYQYRKNFEKKWLKSFGIAEKGCKFASAFGKKKPGAKKEFYEMITDKQASSTRSRSCAFMVSVSGV